jgi:hypothetical protein
LSTLFKTKQFCQTASDHNFLDSLSLEIERNLNNTGLETLKIIRDNLLTIESIEDLEKYLK